MPSHICGRRRWSELVLNGLLKGRPRPRRSERIRVPMTAETIERVHLSVAEARALSERAMRGIGYESEEARILADHVIDAALCGYEYSGLPKLLNVADHPRFKALRSPMRLVRDTAVA